jgi:hypothetical protein
MMTGRESYRQWAQGFSHVLRSVEEEFGSGGAARAEGYPK